MSSKDPFLEGMCKLVLICIVLSCGCTDTIEPSAKDHSHKGTEHGDWQYKQLNKLSEANKLKIIRFYCIYNPMDDPKRKRINIAAALKRIHQLESVDFFDLTSNQSDHVPFSKTTGTQILQLVAKCPLVEEKEFEEDEGTGPFFGPPIYRIRFGFGKNVYMLLSLYYDGTAWIFDEHGVEHRKIIDVGNELNALLQKYNLEVTFQENEDTIDWSRPTKVERFIRRDNKNHFQTIELEVGTKIVNKMMECPVVDAYSVASLPQPKDQPKLYSLRISYSDSILIYVDIFHDRTWIYDNNNAQIRHTETQRRSITELIELRKQKGDAAH